MPSLRGMQLGVPTIDAEPQRYIEYISRLIMLYGGAEWPMNDAVNSQVADNRSNADPTSNVNMLVDGGLENWTSATNLTSWTESVAGTSTVNQETSDIHGGASAARFDVDGSSSAVGIIQNLVGATIGKTYLIRFWAKVSNTTGSPTIRPDFSANTGINTLLSATYTQITRRGVATAANAGLVLGRGSTGSNANKSIYVDDVEILEDGDFDLALPNGSTGVTFGQAGEDGVGTAVDLDGTNGAFTLINRTAWQGMTDFLFGGMINPDVTGANDRLVFKNGEYDVLFNADGTVSVTINYSDSNATCTTSTTFSTGTWQGFAVGISDSDKLPRVYKDGVECAYSSRSAGVGSRVSNTNNIIWFKDASTNGFNGKAQKLYMLKTPPTPALVQTLYDLRNIT